MFSELSKSNLYLRFFGLTKIPLLWFCRPKIISLDNENVEIKIPLKRRTKNHLGSMYFGALSVGADITGGFLAMICIQKSNSKVALIFKDFKANFLKRAEGDVHYICNESKKIAEAVDETLQTGERVNIPIPVVATVPEKFGDEPVAEFSITLSLKEK